MPISRRCCVTACATTPYRPSAASSAATAAKMPISHTGSVNPDRLRFQISSIVWMSASASNGSICLTASRIAGTAAAASPAVCTESLTCMRGACAIGT